MRSVARKSWREPVDAWLPVGILAAVITGGIAASARQPHNAVSVVLLALVPVVALVSAYAAGHPERTLASQWPLSRHRASAIALCLLAVFVAIVAFGGLLQSVVSLPSPRVERPIGDTSAVVVAKERRERGAWPVETLGAPSLGAPAVVQIDHASPDIDWSDFGELRIEAWRAVGPGGWLGGDGAVDPAYEAPFAVAEVPDPTPRRIEMDLSRTRDVGPYLLFLVGIDQATGQRVIIGEPHLDDTTFYGTIVDWLLADQNAARPASNP